VTLNANLTVPNGAALTVVNGLTNNAVVTLAGDGNNTHLNFNGTQTLAGNGQIVLGGVPGNDIVNASGTLTVGSGITIEGAGQLNGDSGNPLVNLGTISADISNSTLFVSYFVNEGLVSAVNGAHCCPKQSDFGQTTAVFRPVFISLRLVSG